MTKRVWLVLAAILVASPVYADMQIRHDGSSSGGAAASITSGTTTCTGSAANTVLFMDGTAINCADGPTWAKGTGTLTLSGTAPKLSVGNAGTTAAETVVSTHAWDIKDQDFHSGNPAASTFLEFFQGSNNVFNIGGKSAGTGSIENFVTLSSPSSNIELALATSDTNSFYGANTAHLYAGTTGGFIFYGDGGPWRFFNEGSEDWQITTSGNLTSVGVRDLTANGLLKLGSGPTTVTDTAGKVLAAALNTVGVPQGGTGLTTLTSNTIYKGNGASAIAVSSITDDGTTITLPEATKIGGGVYYPGIAASSSNGNIAATTNTDYCTSGASAITRTLPAATATGRVVHLVKADNGAGTCIFGRTGSDAINGGTVRTISTQYQVDTCVDAASAQWICQGDGVTS